MKESESQEFQGRRQYPSDRVETVNKLIEFHFDRIKEKVIQKNRDYRASIQYPLGVFHQGDKLAGIQARIDDKLNRIAQVGVSDVTEDTVEDLVGYLVHLIIAKNEQNKSIG